MEDFEKLYEGLPKEKAEAYRKEAIEKYGRENIEQSEQRMLKLGRDGFMKLKAEFEDVSKKLGELQQQDPESEPVQREIARHYQLIETSWGKTPDKESYKGLGDLLASDERYTIQNGQPNPDFGRFMQKAMHVYADAHL